MYVVHDDSGSLFQKIFQHLTIIYVEDDLWFMYPSANMAILGYTTTSFHIEILKLLILLNYKILISF